MAQEQWQSHRIYASLFGGFCYLAMNLPAGAQSTFQETSRSRSDSSIFLEEILVTARKREESLQDAPIAVSAFSGQGLEVRGVTELDEIADHTPNLVIQNNPSFGGASNNASIFIRGIGQSDFIPTVDPGVGIYVDGVYVARSVGAILDLVDIERVEVLRGPQGTLFGRNTIGGALKIETARPHDALAGSLRATIGTDDRIDAQAMLNLPLTDWLFGRFTIATFNQDGYVRRVSDGVRLGERDSLVGRAALRWDASEHFTAGLDFDITRTRETGPPLTLEAISFESQIFDPVDADGLVDPAKLPMSMIEVLQAAPIDSLPLLNNYLATFVGGQDCMILIPGRPPDFGGNPDNPACYNEQFILAGDRSAGTFLRQSEIDVFGLGLTLQWSAAPWLKFKSISAYRRLESAFGRDFDQSPLLLGNLFDVLDQDQFTQELQVNADFFGERLKTVFGVYYFHEDGKNANTLDVIPVKFLSGGRFETESWALYGQATYDILPRLHFTIGGRFTDETKRFDPDQAILEDRSLGLRPDGAIGPLFGVGTPLLPPGLVSTGIEDFTPMITLAFDITSAIMIYGTYSEGFKSGGFNQRVFPPLPEVPSFEPEFAEALEFGFKLSAFDNRVRLNAAAFLTDYDDLQVTVFQEIAPVTSNAAQAEVEGFELEFLASPAEGLALEASFGFTDDDFTEVDPRAIQITVDKDFERVPEWTATASVTYEIGMASFGMLTPRLQWSHRSAFFNDALNRPEIREDGYHVVDFLMRWESSESSYFAQFAVENVTDERFRSSGVFQQAGVLQSLFNRGMEWSFGLGVSL